MYVYICKYMYYIYMIYLSIYLTFQLEFTPCKDGQPLQGMELQENETQKE